MAGLRRLLTAAKDAGPGAGNATLPFGLPALDSHLPDGGLASGGLHEIVPETESAFAAAFGFIAAILARALSSSPAGEGQRAEPRERLGVEAGRPGHGVGAHAPPHGPPPHPHLSRRLRTRPLIFILPAYGQRRHGRLSGHGLNGFGLDPARVILVETAHRKETLWALTEALHSAAPAAVAGLIDRLDLKTSQKLQLTAHDCGLPLLLLRPGATLDASAAMTRWRVGPTRAARDRFGLYAGPRWHLHLERCRNGRPGEWVVEYDHVAHRFSLAAALADPAFSRSACHRAADEPLLRHAHRA